MRTLYVDPGEDTGWAIGSDNDLIDSGTTKMWEFSDAVWQAALGQWGFSKPEWDFLEPHELVGLLSDPSDPCRRVVLENWTLYPWECRKGSLDWDECRTARLIGSLFQACRVADWEYDQQPAKIKERAVAAGAEAYFAHPLRENRHANDAIMHFVYDRAKAAGAAWTRFNEAANG